MSALLLAAALLGQFSGAKPQAIVIDANGNAHVVIVSKQVTGPIYLVPNAMAPRGSALNYSANPTIIGGGMATAFGGFSPILAARAKAPRPMAKVSRHPALKILAMVD